MATLLVSSIHMDHYQTLNPWFSTKAFSEAASKAVKQHASGIRSDLLHPLITYLIYPDITSKVSPMSGRQHAIIFPREHSLAGAARTTTIRVRGWWWPVTHRIRGARKFYRILLKSETKHWYKLEVELSLTELQTPSFSSFLSFPSSPPPVKTWQRHHEILSSGSHG